MPFVELGSPDELSDFIQENQRGCVVCFSASWCGPCKRSKPELVALAGSERVGSVPVGYVLEESLTEDDDDYLGMFATIFLKGTISAFPTYVCFRESGESERIVGVKMGEVLQAMERIVDSSSPSNSK